jgi:MoxR-like ATPase
MELPRTVAETLALLAGGRYVADVSLGTALFLALKLERPLLLEGEAGVGKTEIANVLASALGRPLIRLQCYEGLDSSAALYEWNYSRQMLEIRLAELAGEGRDLVARTIFSEPFLLKRPLPRRSSRAASSSSTSSTAPTSRSRRSCSRSCPTTR